MFVYMNKKSIKDLKNGFIVLVEKESTEDNNIQFNFDNENYKFSSFKNYNQQFYNLVDIKLNQKNFK